MEILFPAARCPLLGIGLPPAFINNILMNIPFEIHFPSVQSGIPYQSLFLNKFSCAYKNAPLAISDNYRPTMNIHNDRTPQANSLSSYRGRGHVYSRKGFASPARWFVPGMVLIGSRIANESLKLALVTCSFRREMFREATRCVYSWLGCVLLSLCRC